MEKDPMSYSAAVTATTTPGVSLVQAVASKVKVAAEEVREKQAVGSTKSLQAISTASVRQAVDRLQAQARRFSGWCCTGFDSLSSRRSSHVFLFLVIILLILAVIYFYMTRPEAISGQQKAGVFDRTSQQHQAAYAGGLPPGSSRSPSFQGGHHRAAFGSVMGSMGTPLHTSKFGSPRGDRNFADIGRQPEATTVSEEEETESSSWFCRDLVVPMQCECILQVPVYAPPGRFSISDMNGHAVLTADAQSSGPGGMAWNVTLKTAQGDPLAHMHEVHGGKEFRILGAKGEYYGSLGAQYEGAQRFLLTTQSGEKLHFWGNFQTQAVNVTNDQNGLLATTEPSEDARGTYYRLRVAPLANVGTSLCALLCIGQLLRSSRLADL